MKDFDLLNISNYNDIKYQDTKNIIDDVCLIIDSAKDVTYASINVFLVKRNWLIGYRIAQEELRDYKRADYGLHIIDKLSKELKLKYGKGFESRNLYYYLNFYKLFPDILNTVCSKSQKGRLLSWSHYRTLLQVKDKKARDWYLAESLNQVWSVRQLQRNINTQYYYRLLKNQIKLNNSSEKNNELFDNCSIRKLEFIKNPVIAEFLGFTLDDSFSENELETRIINNLQKFIMELGKGYSFVERQQHIYTDKKDYFIDLVFYNYILKCFVLVDLKISEVTHQDVGQMDMYVRIYDEMKRGKDDNPTIGILLCAETDEDIARYSILKGNEQLFATKYKLYLPDEKELRAEIEHQKTIFQLQKTDKNN